MSIDDLTYYIADVYAVDFGSVVKVGTSYNFKNRLYHLERAYGSKANGVFNIKAIHGYRVESLAKEKLSKYLCSNHAFSTETFRCSLGRCAKEIVAANDYVESRLRYKYYERDYVPLKISSHVAEKLSNLEKGGVDVDLEIDRAIGIVLSKEYNLEISK